MANKKITRVLLKLSGAALSSKDNVLDFEKLDHVAREISTVVNSGIEIAIVLGGGNIWRGRSSGDMDRPRADDMGMLATTINSIALLDSLEHAGVPAAVFTATPMIKVAEYYTARAAREALSQGKVAILAGCGPMGLVAIDLALHGDIKPSLVVVTDLNKERLERAKQIFSPEMAKKDGIELIFTNSTDKKELLSLTNGSGFDDVFVYAPVPAVVELGDSILGFDGCLNFFAGPLDKAFSANFNFYNVHYAQHHVAGTSGSTPDDMRDIVDLIGEKRIDPSVMITHIGGIDAAIDTTVNLPKIPGGKKLIYTHIELPLTALSDFEELGKSDARFAELDRLVKNANGLWNTEAEKFLLENFK